MALKFGEFLHGRILFVARGAQLARFINEGTRDGVVFYKTQKSERGLRAQVQIKDFAKLRHAARVTHTRVRISAKYGWPFIAARWWRRKSLLAGVLFIGIALSALSQMILSISVSGNTTIPSQQIFESAEELGLRTWIWQRDVDLTKVSKALVEQFPDAAWIGIDRQGTRVQIKVVQKIRPQVPGEAGNLIASKPGLIQELMVIQGTPLVHEGETVKAGQVLIQAPLTQEDPSAKPKENTVSKPKQSIPQAVPAAKGFARGRVWYSAEAKVPLIEDKVEASGNIAKGWGIKFGSRVIMVTTPESPFPQVQEEVENHSLVVWRNWRFPVEVVSINYREMHTVHLERTQEEARRVAEEHARAEVRKKINPGATMIEEVVRVLGQNGGVERVRVEVETYEDLAVYPQAEGQ
jgi:similar to stage IV sporulation protein